MSEPKEVKQPIINAHAHVFTEKHVPPFLAKTFLPFPFYFLAHLHAIVWVYKKVNKFNKIKYKEWYKRLSRKFFFASAIFRTNPIFKILKTAVTYWLTVLTFYLLFDWLVSITNTNFDKDNLIVNAIETIRDFLKKYGLIPENLSNGYKFAIVILVMLFIKSGRNLILSVFKKIFGFFKILPGKHTIGLAKRYLLLAKYAVYKTQTRIFGRMKDQYPTGSGFVILPMDMKYIKAGPIIEPYPEQLEKLNGILTSPEYNKQGVKRYPFVFVDPRRIVEDREKNVSNQNRLFDYDVSDGKVRLNECLVKNYIEDKSFSGFKIYPALGYYPFDEELLAVWKYASDHELPIMTHCIKGTIFYRGKKEKSWNKHPVFMDEYDEKPLLLPEVKNIDFQINFGHPMNYLCLLEEGFLRKLLQKYNNPKLNQLFGYTDEHTALKSDLSKLKICLAHYGGEEHWERYMEKDSYAMSQQVMKRAGQGLEFYKVNEDGEHEYSASSLSSVWKYVDWYSIISSMMMQYENVYADISYILYNPKIFPLLKETLQPYNGDLPNKVLFGTDFYVVRNHNSDKDLYVESRSHLSEWEFDLIARTNPRKYLENTLNSN